MQRNAAPLGFAFATLGLHVSRLTRIHGERSKNLERQASTEDSSRRYRVQERFKTGCSLASAPRVETRSGSPTDRIKEADEHRSESPIEH
jgi:hypothetical protein